MKGVRFHDSKLKLVKALLFRSFHENCRFLFSVYLWKGVLVEGKIRKLGLENGKDKCGNANMAAKSLAKL